MNTMFNGNRQGMQVTNTGLIRARIVGRMTRRDFMKGTLAIGGGAAAFGLMSQAASAGTTVKFMGWLGYDDALKAGSFLEDNDIEVEMTYIDALEEIAAAAASGGMGYMDLATPVSFYVPSWVARGLVEPLDIERIPNLQGVFPKLREADGLLVDGTNYAVPFAWGSLPLMYNADVIKEPPTSWMDLFKEEYKGKVTITEDLVGVIMNFAMAVTGTKTPWLLTREELDETIAVLIKFKKEHALTIVSGYGELTSLFESGDVIMGQSWEAVSMWMGEGAPTMKWVYPKEGTFTFVDVYIMIAETPNKDVNYKILNHVLSPEAQAHTAELNATGVTVEAAVPLLSDPIREMYPYDDIDSFFEQTGGMMKMFPLEPVGNAVSYDEIVEAWEGFLRS